MPHCLSLLNLHRRAAFYTSLKAGQYSTVLRQVITFSFSETLALKLEFHALGLPQGPLICCDF